MLHKPVEFHQSLKGATLQVVPGGKGAVLRVVRGDEVLFEAAGKLAATPPEPKPEKKAAAKKRSSKK